jgi:hypothetical protein
MCGGKIPSEVEAGLAVGIDDALRAAARGRIGAGRLTLTSMLTDAELSPEPWAPAVAEMLRKVLQHYEESYDGG